MKRNRSTPSAVQLPKQGDPIMTKTIAALTAAASALALAACSSEPEYTEMSPDDTVAAEATTDAPLSGVIASDPRFSTLASAVGAAGIGADLDAAGPYTLFAPSDAAFDKLPDGALAELTKPENSEQLANILRYHLVDGRTMAAGLNEAIASSDGSAEIPTVEGTVLLASVDDDGNVLITDTAGNEAMVTEADIAAGNGVIHVVDTVLMPG